MDDCQTHVVVHSDHALGYLEVIFHFEEVGLLREAELDCGKIEMGQRLLVVDDFVL